jgi:hypothetical protein
MGHIRIIIALLMASFAVCVLSEETLSTEVRPGVVLHSVRCRRSPANSYAVYLPSTYTPTKQWPIIYAFDPGAQGEIPVRMYKDVAEKYGYIIAASNDS